MVYEKHVWETEVITSDLLNRIEAQIDELSNHIWIIGDQVWMTHNATYDGSTWGSIDDTKFRLALRLDRSTGKLEILHDVPWRVSGAIDLGGVSGATLQGVIPVPPAATHLHTVPVTAVPSATIVSVAGPFYPTYNGQDLYSYTIPTNLTEYGVPASHGLVKLTVRYTYSSSNMSAVADVYVGGAVCSPLTASGDLGTVTREYSLWAKTGATIVFYGRGPNAGEQHTPVLSDISITLTGCFPANLIQSSTYGALVGLPDATITPYHLSGPAEIECTCNYDGALATMSNFAARPYFPLQPNNITLDWKSGYGWSAAPPTLTFYRGN